MKPLQENNVPVLDARLAAAAAFVRRGCACADIGCDHGKLSAYLAARVCRSVIACDRCETPLSHARAALARGDCENAQCRLGDGLSVLHPDEVDDIVIAGLSGVTLTKILAAAPAFWQPRYRFVFVPASKADYLRRWLYENGFVLLAETAALAAGRVYPVMHVQYTAQCTQPSALFCAAGLLAHTPHGARADECAAAQAYLKKVAAQLRRRGEVALAKEVETCLP